METLQRTANRGSISTGYDIDNSLKVESANSEYFIRTFSSAGTQTTGTVSFWIKRTSLGTFQREVDCSNASGNSSGIFFESDQLCLDFGGAGRHSLRSEAKLRDTSAWYHCMAVWDTTQSTDTERTKLYINGSRVTSFSTATYPSQNATSQFFTPNDGAGSGNNCLFSRHNPASLGQHTPNGYHAEFHYIDGTAKTPSDFGEFDSNTGIWIPIEYTGSHGSNGFYLDFADAANLGDDVSGNNNDWTETNIAAADQATDTPTNNFATGNPILYFSTATTVSEGATKIAKGANGWEILASTMAVTKGKWYVEVRNETMPESAMASIMPDDIELIFRGGQTTNYPGKIVGDEGQGYYSYNGKYYRNGGFEDYGASWTGSTNTIGIALDMDNGKLYFAKDNTWQNSGDPTSGATGTGAIDVLAPTKPHLIGYTPYAANTDGFINFGGYTGAAISSAASDENGYGTFEYAPPTGYYALCSKNLAEYG